MLFTELRFLALFAVAFAVHWALRGDVVRKAWLLLCSCAFYAAWDWRFLGLMLAPTAIDYFVALRMDATTDERAKSRWLAFSLITNLGLLACFKYFNFFIESAATFLGWLGLDAHPHVLAIVLPVGISFYTFQTLSYTIDVRRGHLRAERSLLDFALFVTFFPQLVAGPIVRATTFLPQLRVPRRFARVDVRACAVLFLVGYVKKACIADGLAAAVDPVFASPQAFHAASLWIAVACYAAQIYCDFSGYSDMAIAIAGMFGYRLTKNFDAPYLAHTVTEFWRRWHISLSTWFRDYLYVPLGGNRGSASRTAFNLFVVFLLCGLWHGAAWTFVAWGLLHGAFLAAERVFGARKEPASGIAVAARHALTLVLVCVAWVFFRSPSLAAAWTYLRGAFLMSEAPAERHVSPAYAFILVAAFLAHVLSQRSRVLERCAQAEPWLFAPAFGIAVALALPFAATRFQPFIYFQF